MSFQNKNLYHLLGNDVEEPTSTAPVKEIVKNSGSSKKADVPPPKADPSKAKKKTNKTTGNEAAFKTKNNNKSVPSPANTAVKGKKSFDRRSHSGKTDSAKKFKQGWGNDDGRELSGEIAGAEDAAAELAAETSEPAAPVGKSLQDYLAEQAAKSAPVAKAIRAPNQGAEDKWGATEQIVKEQESYVVGTTTKKVKSKQQKEKKFLDFEAKFADQKSAPQPRSNKKGPRKNGDNKSAGNKKPTVNDENFPAL